LRKWAWINGAVVLFILAGCRQEQPKTGVLQVKIDIHQKERPAAVSFGIEADGKQLPDHWLYRASYTRNGKTARFGIEFVLANAKPSEGSPRIGNGSFIADPKSFNRDLLQDLENVLNTKIVPKSDIHVRQLPFRFFIEGENLDRGPDGSLIDAATGNSVKMKIFLGPQQNQEIYLNFQKPGGTGEFAMSDPAFGNAALQELAKVL